MPTVNDVLRMPVYQRAYHRLPPNPNDILFGSVTNTFVQVGGSMARTTNSNPAWRKLIAKRQDASAYYLVQRQTASTGPARCKVQILGTGANRGGEGRCIYNGVEHMPSNFSVIGKDSALQDLALTRLKRKLKTTIGSVQVLAPTAEVRELRGLIGQVARESTKMIQIMIDIKRMKGVSVSRLDDTAEAAYKKAAEAWLAFNFGIRPLVDDVSNVVRSIEDYLRRKDFGIRESASAKKEWLGGYPMGPYSGTYGANLRHTVRLSYRLSYRWYCGGATSLGAGNHYGLSEHLGISSEQLLPALWELTPYSWVVDYFTTVGVFLDDLFWVLPGIMSYSGCTRRFECQGEVDNFFTPWGGTPSEYYDVTSTKGVGKFTRFEFERVPFGANLPHVGLHLRSFDEIGYFGVTKLLNLASVLVK